MASLWANLAPHNNAFVLNEPNLVSGNIAIPKPVVATVSKWLLDSPKAKYSDAVWRNMELIPTL